MISHTMRTATEAPPMRRKLKPTIKPIPRFRSEAEERQFWETHDTADYLD
jgi:hypothetical protein